MPNLGGGHPKPDSDIHTQNIFYAWSHAPMSLQKLLMSFLLHFLAPFPYHCEHIAFNAMLNMIIIIITVKGKIGDFVWFGLYMVIGDLLSDW